MPKTPSEQLFEHAQKFATPFRTTLEYPWALVPDGPDRYRGFAVSSAGFRQWLKQSYHTEHWVYPTQNAIESAVKMFDAHAQRSTMTEGEVFTRVGWRGNRNVPQAVLLHLGNLRGEVVEITPRGNRILSTDQSQFLTNSSTAPLPRPIDNGLTLRDHLRRLLDLQGVALDRAIVWLFSALRPSPPYPVMVVSGPSGSGKSTLIQMLRFLIDPSIYPTQDVPVSHHVLFSQALHNHVLAYDEAGPLSGTAVSWLLRIASGDGFAMQANAKQPAPMGRPVIVTSASSDQEWMRNALLIELPEQNPERVLSHGTLAEKHIEAAPAVLGTLCKAVTSVLSSAAVEQTPPVARFQESYRWCLPAAAVLGLTPEQINAAVAGNRLVDALTAVLQTEQNWTGTASNLANKIQSLGFGGFARNSRQLSNDIKSTDFSVFGINVEHRAHGSIHITRNAKVRIRRGSFRTR